ncbi:hypothetical protein EXU57_21895 [Segetibacter sp. 3557_3]|nr:hypothetical protein EXU57_21895 [Segetibacter sp. 3557_3]
MGRNTNNDQMHGLYLIKREASLAHKMNFEFMPELRQRWGYPGVLLLMLVVAFCIYLWFRKKRWL